MKRIKAYLRRATSRNRLNHYMFIAKRLTDITLIEKNVYSKERVKPWFLVTFNIILRHNFPENFIKFPQLVQKI